MNAPMLPLPPFPTGWYCLAVSDEVKRGIATRRRFVGREVVLFRTSAGDVAALDAYCPHLGAHMGYGGRVEGDALRCPFHGFLFDKTGECVGTPYGALPSPKCIVPSWPVHEVNGFILAYHHPDGEAPTWRIPEIPARGYGRMRTRTWPIESHPQETTENSVDVGHFATVHGYTDFESIAGMESDGPHLKARYAFTRPDGLIRNVGSPIRIEIGVEVHGLGYSMVEVDIPQYGLRTRQWVLPTPYDSGRIELRVGLSVGPLASNGHSMSALRLLPRGLLRWLVTGAAFRGFCKDVSDDFVIWNNKRYVDPPLLARGDGPVMKYRRWAKQFYE